MKAFRAINMMKNYVSANVLMANESSVQYACLHLWTNAGQLYDTNSPISSFEDHANTFRLIWNQH